MKAVYGDFINTNPNCSRFDTNPDAMAVFDFLNQDTNIIKMIDLCEMGKPALAGCISELESYYDSMQAPSIDFSAGFTRTAIGRMVRTILEPFGYVPTIQKTFPKSCAARYFTSASCYSKTMPATMRVVKRIEEI
ncbi:MAG: hypothetical protein K2P04_01015 [Oscillospiraceae bacterium]|nr:hypothetical protein [Oscillospiraceae bacterium]